jgi:hypothetical protein
MQDVLYARAASLLEAEIDDEIVGLDREQGEVFGFNKVASDVWRLLKEPQSAGNLSAELQKIYDVSADQCVAELTTLLDELVALKLVKRLDADRGIEGKGFD